MYYHAYRALYQENISKNSTITHPFSLNPTSLTNIHTFVLIIVVALVGNFVRAFGVVWALMKCSCRLHDKMFDGVLKAPLYFFSTHCSGIYLLSHDIILYRLKWKPLIREWKNQHHTGRNLTKLSKKKNIQKNSISVK